MRLLLVGAFPYPHDQGSQVYFQEQAIALRAAGADVSLVTYGAGRKLAGRGIDDRSSGEYWRAIDGFEHHASPAWTAPSSLRSGPGWARPLADLGLAMTLRDAVASCSGEGPDDAYDAILTHNAEAALVALYALPRPRPPILYCVHTILGEELSKYLKRPEYKEFSRSTDEFKAIGRTARGLDRIGAGIDRWIAARVDAWLVLTQSAERVMRQSSKAPGALVAPPAPDPELAQEPPRPGEVARRHALEPGRFFLYSGNLDPYQELDILAATAAELASRMDTPPILVVANHIGRHGDRIAVPPGWAEAMPGVEFRGVKSAWEMQSLLAGARASLVMRRAVGGFPIKLVNSLAVGRPVIAFHEDEWGLEDERNSLICSPDQPVMTLANAIERLANDDVLAKRLAAGARALYLERHQPEEAAAETLGLLGQIGVIRKR
jgi:glycosyltransferase involved in cell wall biosynthesis